MSPGAFSLLLMRHLKFLVQHCVHDLCTGPLQAEPQHGASKETKLSHIQIPSLLPYSKSNHPTIQLSHDEIRQCEEITSNTVSKLASPELPLDPSSLAIDIKSPIVIPSLPLPYNIKTIMEVASKYTDDS
jgi:hypothetical protein